MQKFLLRLTILIVLSGCSFDVFSQKTFEDLFPDQDKSEVVKKANKKLAADDVDGALRLLDAAIEKNQDLFEAYRRRATIRQFYLNNMDGAIADLTKLLEIKPDHLESAIRLGNLKRRKKDFQGALKDYEAARKFHPGEESLIIETAYTKSALKDFDGAFVELTNALKTNPGSLALNRSLSNLLVAQKKPDQAIAHLQNFLDAYRDKRNGELPELRGERVKKNKIPQKFSGDDASKNSSKARRYSQMEFTARSIEDWMRQQQELDDIRSLAATYIELAKLYIARNNDEKAFVSLNTALEIDKNQEEAYGLRGIIYLSRGENEKAIIELSKAAGIADEPYFYLNRGIAYLLINNRKKAQADFDYFLKLYPDGKPVLDRRTAEAEQKLSGNLPPK